MVSMNQNEGITIDNNVDYTFVLSYMYKVSIIYVYLHSKWFIIMIEMYENIQI